MARAPQLRLNIHGRIEARTERKILNPQCSLGHLQRRRSRESRQYAPLSLFLQSSAASLASVASMHWCRSDRSRRDSRSCRSTWILWEPQPLLPPSRLQIGLLSLHVVLPETLNSCRSDPYHDSTERFPRSVVGADWHKLTKTFASNFDTHLT